MKLISFILLIALIFSASAFKAQFKKHHNKIMATFNSSKTLTKLYSAQFNLKSAEYKQHLQFASEEYDEFQACMLDGIQNQCGAEVTGENADLIMEQAQDLESFADSLEYEEEGDMTSESVDQLQDKILQLENDPSTGEFWSCTFAVVQDCAE